MRKPSAISLRMAAQNASLLAVAHSTSDRTAARATSETTPAPSVTQSALNIVDYQQQVAQNAAELIVTVGRGTLSLMLGSLQLASAFLEGAAATFVNAATEPKEDIMAEVGFREALLGQLKTWADNNPDQKVMGTASSGTVLTRQDIYSNIRERTHLGIRLLNSWDRVAAKYIMSVKMDHD
jgi:hypothetical protein